MSKRYNWLPAVGGGTERRAMGQGRLRLIYMHIIYIYLPNDIGYNKKPELEADWKEAIMEKHSWKNSRHYGENPKWKTWQRMQVLVSKSSWIRDQFNLIKVFHKFWLAWCLLLRAGNTFLLPIFRVEKKSPWQTARKCMAVKWAGRRPPQCDFIRSSSMNSMQNCFSIMAPKYIWPPAKPTHFHRHKDIPGAQARWFRIPFSPSTRKYNQFKSILFASILLN